MPGYHEKVKRLISIVVLKELDLTTLMTRAKIIEIILHQAC